MKKSFAFIMTITLLAALFTASCTASAPTGAPAVTPRDSGQAFNGPGMPSPIKEATPEQIQEELGISFNIPERAEDISYQVIEGGGQALAQALFTLDGVAVTYRIQPAAEFTDISGAFFEWEEDSPVSVGYLTGQAHYNKGAEGICLWYDTVPGLMYSVFVGTGADEKKLKALANELFMPVQGDEPGAAQPAPFTDKDAEELFANLKTFRDCLFLAKNYSYEASYFVADDSLHIHCYNEGDESKTPVLSFAVPGYALKDGEEPLDGAFVDYDLPEDVLELGVRVEYINYAEIGWNAIRGLYIGSTREEVLAAFPSTGFDFPGILYDVTLINPAADRDWGRIRFEDELSVGGQAVTDDSGVTKIIYIYSEVSAPPDDDWRSYDRLTFTLGADNKVANIEYMYSTDSE